ncbi:hypothetical protein AN644_04045 [Candidatus Epulonipiscium fishelsonii]|nr:hypothetical protein AN644_04045 [Epulopiscium sp. SCG-C06WGA-EpuloA1]
MPKYLVLPKIGMNMEEGVITEWLVNIGDYVEKEQMVVRAETDKSIQDMFATDSGIVHKFLVEVGDTVPCQEKIIMLLEKGEAPPADDAVPAAKVTAGPAKEEAPATTISAPQPTGAPISKDGRIRISPLAKKVAKEMGVPLDKLYPSKEGHRIVKADVLRISEELKAAPAVPTATATKGEAKGYTPLSGTRKVIASRMRESVAKKPRVALTTTVNCENLMSFRNMLKDTQKIGYNEIMLKACAAALRTFKDLNIITHEDGIITECDMNMGIAVEGANGLVVPVIKDVDRKGIFEISTEFLSLVDKARNGNLSMDEMSGGIFTISNLGSYGVESFDPIINAPECFILGVGAMIKTPVVIGDEIKVQTCMKISLSFDHAIVDGAPASKLLQKIKTLLENPIMMLA